MGLRNNVPGCLTCKYTNTNTQIHKYANTALVKVADRHDMCYIFEKVMVRGPRKQCSRVSDLQIHKYKYTNTQIQHWSKLQIDMTRGLKSPNFPVGRILRAKTFWTKCVYFFA